MEYVVLARKLRPQRFDALIGQETVATILRNAVVSGRVAHAYLFAGSRGVGKTSAARILTKAINCHQPEEGEPCNACPSCEEITANASPDVYEIDAASNRGIDNIRELRENANYRPAKSRYKTYIIDEAHMLTMESFNALLKTLEEPPERVIFILATTSPHRIPDTIQSRCQRFDFSRIPVALMTGHLGRIAEQEGLTLSTQALETIARNAAGGMRDALTALDQVVSFAGNAPSDEDVLRMLGLIDAREIFELLDAVLTRTLDKALRILGDVVERGHDVDTLLAAIVRELKDLSLYVSLSGDDTYFQDHPPEALSFYRRHAAELPLDLLQQLFHLFLDLEQQLNRTAQTRACFEMALVKACRVESLVGVSDLLGQARALLDATAGGAAPAPPRRGPPSGSSGPAGPPESQPSAEAERKAVEGGRLIRGGDVSAASGATATAPTKPPEPPLPPESPQPSPVRPVGSNGDTQPVSEETVPVETSPVKTKSEAAESPSAKPEFSQPPPAAPQSDPATAGERSSPASAAAPAAPGNAAPMQPAQPAPDPAAESAQGTQPANSSDGEGQAANPSNGEPPQDNGMDSQPLPPLPEHSLCDDPRYVSLVEAIRGSSPKMAAVLRRTEVDAWEELRLTLIMPSESETLSADEQEQLARELRQTCGEGFELNVIDGKNRIARPEHTLSGRERLALAHREMQAREEAKADATVQDIQRIFPKASIGTIELNPSVTKERGDV